MITPVVPAARQQSGVVSRTQALASGLTPRQVDHLVRSGRWRRLAPGVFAVHTRPLDARARVWAAVLHAGQGACAGGATALWLCGVVDEPPAVVTICIPEDRRLARVPGMRIVRRRGLDRMRHPAACRPGCAWRRRSSTLPTARAGRTVRSTRSSVPSSAGSPRRPG